MDAVVPDTSLPHGGSSSSAFGSLHNGNHQLPGAGQHESGLYGAMNSKMYSYDGQQQQQQQAATNGMPSVVPVYDKRLMPRVQQPAPSAATGATNTNTNTTNNNNNNSRLTISQHSELEMARRRAEKFAEGKRANASAARRAKRRASRAEGPAAVPERSEVSEDPDDEGMSHGQGRDEIEAKLATVEDEKEAKRLKRLLRNRVSAQQARERKKSYVSTLESKSGEQDDCIAQLSQRLKTLERENVMLRQIIKNMQQGPTEDAGEPQPYPPQ